MEKKMAARGVHGLFVRRSGVVSSHVANEGWRVFLADPGFLGGGMTDCALGFAVCLNEGGALFPVPSNDGLTVVDFDTRTVLSAGFATDGNAVEAVGVGPWAWGWRDDDLRVAEFLARERPDPREGLERARKGALARAAREGWLDGGWGDAAKSGVRGFVMEAVMEQGRREEGQRDGLPGFARVRAPGWEYVDFRLDGGFGRRFCGPGADDSTWDGERRWAEVFARLLDLGFKAREQTVGEWSAFARRFDSERLFKWEANKGLSGLLTAVLEERGLTEGLGGGSDKAGSEKASSGSL